MLPPAAAGAELTGAAALVEAAAAEVVAGAGAEVEAPAAAELGAAGLFFLLLHASSNAPGTTARPAAPARPLSTERRLSGVSAPGVPDPESDMVPPSVW